MAKYLLPVYHRNFSALRHKGKCQSQSFWFGHLMGFHKTMFILRLTSFTVKTQFMCTFSASSISTICLKGTTTAF